MTDRMSRNRGLGRGLAALISDVGAGPDGGRPSPPDRRLPIELLRPNPAQPRRSFPEADLAELAASIRERGIIQPLIVRPDPDLPESFQIVAGERRWRAAQAAGLHEVPVLVREYSDAEVLEVAIIENIQRADLNAIDEAAAYRQLADRFGRSAEQIATALGRSRSHVANMLRLLTLPAEVQQMVVAGTLTAGHARALIGHPDAAGLARTVAARNLSVRQTEALVKSGGPGKPRSRAGGPAPVKDADTRLIESELAAALGMGVSIEQDRGAESGRLVLRYRTLAQLDDLLRTLSGG